MPQLYAQTASRPDPWLLGRTSAGLCTLQAACPLTVTYSGGTPAADTIAAGSAATVYGGSAAAFDASADVWVVLTVPASGALQVVKEAALATVTGDWAGLARIVQHAVEPYQPQAYLAAGGGGTVTSTTYPAIISTPGAERVRSTPDATLSSEPASWWLPGFDDSGWAGSVVSGTPGDGSVSWGEITLPDGAVSITDVDNGRANGVYLFVRRTFTLPAAPILSATLVVAPDSYVDAVWVNGTSVWSEVGLDNSTNPTYEDVTETLPIGSLLTPGATNTIAIRNRNGWRGGPNNPVRVVYHLSVVANAGGGIPAPAAPAEGDILYYHAGAWVDLPIGTSGQELTVVAGDPAWTDQPADVDTSGTVTSVAFSGPTGTTTGGSPITGAGTISLSWASQSAGTFLGAPSGSSGAPTFRALVGADIPVDASTIVVSAGTIKGNYQAGSGVSISGNTISATGSGGSVTSVALSMPSSVFSTSGSPVTTSGTLVASLASQSPHTFWGGPASGSAAAPTFRALAASDLPAAASAGGHIHAHGHFH